MSRRLRSASSFVVNCAVFAPCCALLEGGGSFSVPYSASATCCGDARFTRAPSGMAAAAADSIPASLRRKSPTAARTADGSKPKPTCSICPSAAATLPSVRTTFGSSPAVARRRCASEADARISARKPRGRRRRFRRRLPRDQTRSSCPPPEEPSLTPLNRDDTAAIPPRARHPAPPATPCTACPSPPTRAGRRALAPRRAPASPPARDAPRRASVDIGVPSWVPSSSSSSRDHRARLWNPTARTSASLCSLVATRPSLASTRNTYIAPPAGFEPATSRDPASEEHHPERHRLSLDRARPPASFLGCPAGSASSQSFAARRASSPASLPPFLSYSTTRAGGWSGARTTRRRRRPP